MSLLLEHMSASVDTGGKKQARANRRHALNAWLVGGDGNRWPGDDGRALSLAEAAFWPPPIAAAETAKFAELDAVYEQVKTNFGL